MSAPPVPPLRAARSNPRVVRATRQPSLTSPSRALSGTATSVEEDLVERGPPVICRRGRTSTPGVSMGRRNAVMPPCFGAAGSVRARR